MRSVVMLLATLVMPAGLSGQRVATTSCAAADSVLGPPPARWKTKAERRTDKYTGAAAILTDWERAFGATALSPSVDMMVAADPADPTRLFWRLRMFNETWEYHADRTLDVLADGERVVHRETAEVLRTAEVDRESGYAMELLTVTLSLEEAATLARATQVQGRVRRKEFVLREQNHHQFRLVYQSLVCPAP